MPDLFVATSGKPHSLYPPENGQGQTSGKTAVMKKGGHHPLIAFYRLPEGITFENQEKDERIYLFLRRHFITNVKWIITTIIFTLFPPAFLMLQSLFPITVFEIPGNILLTLLLFYYLILFGFAFVNYVSWFYNVGIVTNLRVIDIDVTSLQHKNVAATSLSDIVDVEYNQKGFFGNILDYGDVHMQTEGLKPNFEYLSVPHPAQIADVIADLKAKRSIT